MSVAPTPPRVPRGYCALLAAVALLVVLAAAPRAASAFGVGSEVARLDGVALTVFTYRPLGCAEPSLLFVFHGNGRTAERYRDHALPLAESACFLVFAPLFDKERFSNARYHRGGLVDGGEVRPRPAWTTELIDDLIAWARTREGRPDAPFYLFGHSAGGQFLSRVAAFALPADAERIVVANPSSYIVPSLEEAAPYGFGGVFTDEAVAEAQLRAYLALPLTIYIGDDDTGDKDLLDNEPARRQGRHRRERGERVYAAAAALAQAQGWPFGWNKVYATGVGHSARGMLAAEEALTAFGFAIVEAAR
jgi:dienelactone hydrolase